MSETRTCLDLFSGLGGFSAAFEEADGWDVVTVDLDPDGRFDPDIKADVMDLQPSDLPNADLILASPPCDRFSLMNVSKYWTDCNPDHKETQHRVMLTYHTVGLIRSISPDYWFLENPRGMMRHVLYWPPTGTVWYCRYGDDRAKPTDLWGNHPYSFEYRKCSRGNTACHHDRARRGESYAGTQNRNITQAERAIVPYGLSKAILSAVEAAYANPPPQQTTLGEVSQP